jgi:anionic cell wall polymer biosynthesis LytR-Cps2A-Psr (LCP) family protein
MSEEQEGGLSGLKKTIIGVATTAVTAAGVYLTTNINKFFGVEEETEVKTEQVAETPAQGSTANGTAAAPIVVNIENTNQQKQSGGETKVVERVIEKPAPAPAKPVEDEDPW